MSKSTKLIYERLNKRGDGSRPLFCLGKCVRIALISTYPNGIAGAPSTEAWVGSQQCDQPVRHL